MAAKSASESFMTREEIYSRKGWKVPLAFKALSKVTFIPIFFIAVILLSVSLLPSTYLLRWTFSVYDGLTPSGLLDMFFLTAMFGCAYVAFGISLLVFGGVLKRSYNIFARIKEGEYPFLSMEAGYWSVVNGIIIFNRQFFLELTRTSTLLILFYKLMGMKIGKRCIINSTFMYDPDMVEIGNDVTIGGDAMILGHVGERGVLRFKKVIIGDKVDIGQSSLIMPGVVIGEGSTVGALSFVTKNTQIPPYEIWAGVPAKRIKKLKGHRSPDHQDNREQ